MSESQLDYCGLCPYPLRAHTVMTEECRDEHGRLGVRAIGWRCPEPVE